jgi:hypothetical protein
MTSFTNLKLNKIDFISICLIWTTRTKSSKSESGKEYPKSANKQSRPVVLKVGSMVALQGVMKKMRPTLHLWIFILQSLDPKLSKN